MSKTELDEEASTLGLPPGVWPRELVLDGVKLQLKELRHDGMVDEDEVSFALYENETCILTVWND